MSERAFASTRRLIAVLFVVGITSTAAFAQTSAERTLFVYGPGGPLSPMQEAAARFGKAHGVKVVVTGGPEARWVDKAQQDGDVVYGGAEYMLSQLAMKHPTLVDRATREELYARPAGILVRKGNPKRIRRLEDLTRPGIHIIDVQGAGQLGMWEDMAGEARWIDGIQKNISAVVGNSGEAVERWKKTPELDAWITFESWHYRLEEETDLVRLRGAQRVHRGTPVALTTFSDEKELARAFIRYLKSTEGEAIFVKWGWSRRAERRRAGGN